MENTPAVLDELHVMIDTETLSTKPNAAIASIGAVVFNMTSCTLHEEFYHRIDLDSAMRFGEVSASTLKWWLRQSESARQELAGTSGRTPNTWTLPESLWELRNWILSVRQRAKKVYIWGNGADFDQVILTHAFEATNIKLPWRFYDYEHVRGLVRLGRMIGFDPKRDTPFEGTAHNALEDAKHQARYVMAIQQKLMAPHRIVAGRRDPSINAALEQEARAQQELTPCP